MARFTVRLLQGAILTCSAAALALACSASGGGGSNFGSGASGNGASGNSTGGGYGFGGSGSGSGGNGSGTGGGVNLGGSGNGSGTGGAFSGDACAATHTTGQQKPLDMYIMMDESGSMDGTKWNGVKSAITSFVNAGAPVKGIGVGIQFFPPMSSGGGTGCTPAFPPCAGGCINVGGICFPTGGGSGSAECDPNTYLPPAVMIQPLPGVAQSIINAMNAHSPGGGTPTLPAMQSAVQATTAYAKQHPDHKVIIVLATDGEPNDCNSTVANVSQEAATAFNSSPSVMTFVIGIGTVANMDQIAQAGGSGKAIQVDTANANQSFLDAMNKIRGTALGCDYLLPTAAGGGTINFSMVNVAYTPAGGSAQPIYGVKNASQCGTTAAWYYDPPLSQGTPTKIVLCPNTCKQVESSKGAVDIQLGCATQPPPVQ